ncbi:YutD family protein [Streptococcus henryi]|uniref:YutD family protein n=1 Tax=Streptococcus henryi TaxID=439219 RepID=UPI00037DB38A|nr:YutD-like domain-containing protein [Streptococcus henryi]
MRKEISPEMYNYNKFPGPQFITFENQVKSDDYSFVILENIKDAFDPTVFSQRFSEILLKYDYIVGDWGNEQLRLKGFYKDNKDAKKSNRISRLDDYIKEYCNFGCAYFILENPEPQEVTFEEERSSKRRKSSRKRSGNRSREEVKSANNKVTNKHFSTQKRKDNRVRDERSKKRQQQKEIQSAKQHFVIRKKEK